MFSDAFYHSFKNQIIPMPFKLFQITEKEYKLLDFLCKVKIMLIPKPDRYCAKKKAIDQSH